MNKYIAILLLSCGLISAQQKSGKTVFEAKCAKCHGVTGTKGRFGAANLQLSRLQTADMIRIISKGKNWMPSWERNLKSGEIIEVAEYVKTLRTK